MEPEHRRLLRPVREELADTSHDFALAIRYRFEPADLRAAHACP